MGYRVRIKPSDGRVGWLRHGRLAPPWSSGTWYESLTRARQTGSNWLSRHPGGKCEIVEFLTNNVREVLHEQRKV